MDGLLRPHTSQYNNGGVYTNVPLNMAWKIKDGEVGCPVRVYEKDSAAAHCQPVSQPKCGQEIVYQVLSHADYTENCAVAYSSPQYDNTQGYPATSIGLPSLDYNVYSGTGIYFDQLETGFRINNGGIISVDVRGVPGSGIIVTNSNSRNNPIFNLSINPAELVASNGLIKSVIFNGQTYTPVQGVVNINSGLFGGGIQNITSPSNTIFIAPSSVGSVIIDIKPVTVNGIKINPANDGTPINLVDGVNTKVSSNGNKVQVDVLSTSFVKTVNSQAPDLNGNINVNPTKIFYQSAKVLVAADITALNGAGFDLVATVPSNGTNASVITATDGVMLFQNAGLITLNKYTRTGNFIKTTGVSFTAGDILTWIVMKST
jgi:hypothetical protein